MPPADFFLKESSGTAAIRVRISVLGGFTLLYKALGSEPMPWAVCLVVVPHTQWYCGGFPKKNHTFSSPWLVMSEVPTWSAASTLAKAQRLLEVKGKKILGREE